jgi:hypothetical protein
MIALPMLASATTYVDISSGWNDPIQNTQATSYSCTGGNNANWWNINNVASSTGQGQEFSYSRAWGFFLCSGTESKTVYMGIYGSNFTWTQPTGHYTYDVTWDVSYNISMQIRESGAGDCSAPQVASAYLIIKTNVYDQDNQTNEWPNGASGTMNNPSLNCPSSGLNSYWNQTYPQGDVTFNPAGHDGLYLVDGDYYSIWSEMILKSLSTTSTESTYDNDWVDCDIDMQHNSQYGQIVSFVISS